VRAKTSKNCKNTEFRTILEMGLRGAYAGRAVAVLAYEALKDTHTEHPAALGRKRRWCFRRTGWWRGTQGLGSSATLRLYSRTGYPLNLGTNLVPPPGTPRVPPKFRYSPLNSWRKAPRRAWPRRRGNIDVPAVLSPTVAEYTQVGCPIMQDCVCGAFQPFLSRS
jgi:hypothetical protein